MNYCYVLGCDVPRKQYVASIRSIVDLKLGKFLGYDEDGDGVWRLESIGPLTEAAKKFGLLAYVLDCSQMGPPKCDYAP